ncbi:hypothetical protein JQX13_15560 [Archangium violaceum]|uniref:mannan-binding protein n=1 Tax=Archangium violaceum TaxID=83451 RepID=UPI00193C5D8C|nr:mannan-binding protein [Archangium violaceum]QRK11359.1 hypothetical protein JQX13_15560 [Archangium violaceum]
MKWMLSVMTAVLVFVSVGVARAADAPSCDAKTAPIANQQDANNRCPAVCTSAGYEKWNGQWTNTPPSGAGPVCDCYLMKAADVKTTPLANQQDADKRCPTVCANAKATWNGQWTNTPPAGGGTVCGCLTPACG